MIDLNLNKTSGVYVVRASVSDAVKIGRAVNIKSRLRELQTGSHVELILERVLETPGRECTVELEKNLHYRYRAKRTIGEWFTLTKQEVFDMPDYDELSGENRRAMTAFLDGIDAPAYMRVASIEDLARPAISAVAQRPPYPGFTCDEHGYDRFGIHWPSFTKSKVGDRHE